MSQEPTMIPEEGPRLCPECGVRVAALATSCLMCGASLTEEKAPREQAPPRRSRLLFTFAVVVVVAFLIVVSAYLLEPLVFPGDVEPTTPPSPTPTATATHTATPSPVPTVTPTPPPPPPRAHQIQPGETLASIAQAYGTTMEEILALNPDITPELLQVDQVLLIPPAVEATSEAEVTEEAVVPTPNSGDLFIHVVAPGDTLLSIARHYSVTVSLIRAANPDIPAGSDVIQVNQSLVIPLGTPMPTAMPTPDPNATPTPLPLYQAPLLLSPPDEAVFGGPEAVVSLQWASVGILRPGEWYEVRVARPGADPFVARTRSTGYRVPAELFPPEGTIAREFRWQVRIVRESQVTDDLVDASVQGQVRMFLWLEQLPTPTPSPSPNPDN